MVHETTSGGWARRRAEARSRILDAALVLVSEGGLEALTVQALARSLGYSAGAIYRYYNGKDALMAALVAHAVSGVRQAIRDAVARATARGARRPSPLSPGDRALLALLVAARVYASQAEARPAAFALLSRMVGDPRVLVPGEAAAPVVAPVAALLAEVAELVVAAEAAGVLAPGPSPRRRAVALWAALQGALQVRKLARFRLADLAPRRVYDDVLNGLLTGWGADPARLAALAPRASRLARALPPAAVAAPTEGAS